MTNKDEQAKGCAVVIAVLLAIGSCCNETVKSCSSSSNEETIEATEVVIENTNTNAPSTYETPEEQPATQTVEMQKQVSSVNILDMIKTISDDVRVVGVFQADENVYQMIYCRKNQFYMQSVFTFDNGTWGDSERLIKLSNTILSFL